jgi:hypothetical protein
MTMRPISAMLTILLLGFSQSANADQLDWMVGCWETPDGMAKEVWVKEEDGSLTGFNVVLGDGQVRFYEILRITTSADGTLTYTAHPSGQSTTTFDAPAASGQEVTFSNPSHDYPQQIKYRRDGSILYATISFLSGKDPRTFNKRACE